MIQFAFVCLRHVYEVTDCFFFWTGYLLEVPLNSLYVRENEFSHCETGTIAHPKHPMTMPLCKCNLKGKESDRNNFTVVRYFLTSGYTRERVAKSQHENVVIVTGRNILINLPTHLNQLGLVEAGSCLQFVMPLISSEGIDLKLTEVNLGGKKKGTWSRNYPRFHFTNMFGHRSVSDRSASRGFIFHLKT